MLSKICEQCDPPRSVSAKNFARHLSRVHGTGDDGDEFSPPPEVLAADVEGITSSMQAFMSWLLSPSGGRRGEKEAKMTILVAERFLRFSSSKSGLLPAVPNMERADRLSVEPMIYSSWVEECPRLVTCTASTKVSYLQRVKRFGTFLPNHLFMLTLFFLGGYTSAGTEVGLQTPSVLPGVHCMGLACHTLASSSES